jgi:hypothetical protein
MKEEIERYIAYAYNEDAKLKYDDVYVTDHTSKPKQYHTTSQEDDDQFFKYQ